MTKLTGNETDQDLEVIAEKVTKEQNEYFELVNNYRSKLIELVEEGHELAEKGKGVKGTFNVYDFEGDIPDVADSLGDAFAQTNELELVVQALYHFLEPLRSGEVESDTDQAEGNSEQDPKPTKFQFTKGMLHEALKEMLDGGGLTINDVEKHFGSPDGLVDHIDDTIYEMGSEDLEEHLKKYTKATIEMMLEVARDEHEEGSEQAESDSSGVHTAGDPKEVAEKQLARLKQVINEGLDDVKDWLWDFYPDFSWHHEGAKAEIEMLLNHPEFEEVAQQFQEKMDFDIKEELQETMKAHQEVEGSVPENTTQLDISDLSGSDVNRVKLELDKSGLEVGKDYFLKSGELGWISNEKYDSEQVELFNKHGVDEVHASGSVETDSDVSFEEYVDLCCEADGRKKEDLTDQDMFHLKDEYQSFSSKKLEDIKEHL